MIVKDGEQIHSLASSVINGGGVLAFRTDTFYGLGADPFDLGALRRINDLKGRDGKAVLVVISDAAGVSRFAHELPERFDAVCARHWPGPLTIVVKAKEDVPDLLTAGSGTVGLRLPDDEEVREFVRACGGALTATSANLAGEPPATTAEEVAGSFPSGLDLIVDGGLAPGGKPSTVLDLSGPRPRLIREGAVTLKELVETLPDLIT